ncbi:unnamed protein product [Urochloa humidicola]
MVTTRSGDLTRSTRKNKRACNAGGETTETLISDDSTKKHLWTSPRKKQVLPHVKSSKAVKSGEQPTGDISSCHPDEPFGDVYGEGVWRGLSKTASSNVHRIVVALASFNGETKMFACTGFFIEWNQSTVILTSASLVRSSGHKNKIVENLRIEVLLPNKQRELGTLQHYSLHYNVALVTVKDHRAPHPASIQLQYFKCSKVAAVGRCFESGTLMAANGQLVDWTSTHDCKFLVHSSCRITKAGIGGPLVDFADGKVLGMNFYDKKIGTPFLLWKQISNILSYFLEKEKSRVSQTDGTGKWLEIAAFVQTGGLCMGHIGGGATAWVRMNLRMRMNLDNQ